MPRPPDLPPPAAPWRGSLAAALTRAAEFIAEHHLPLPPPTERQARDWRAQGLLTVEGRHFTARNVTELLRIRQLRGQGLPVALIKDQLQLSDEQLRAALLGESAPVPHPSVPDPVWATAVLLAHGVSKQFEQVRDGHIVGEYRALPTPLRQAQAHLARLAILNGESDRFAGLHDLLVACTQPMRAWAPAPLAQHPDYADLILIDPDYRVPSEDCRELAEQGGHLEDLVEVQLHRDLSVALTTLPQDERPAAYTAVRQFIAEHPLASRDELRLIRNDPRLNADLVAFLDRAYRPAHPADAGRDGQVSRCARCAAPLVSGVCRLVSCRVTHEPLSGASVALADAYLARPELLKYWCDPAQEELRLYRALRAVHGDAAQLYPFEDACDVSLGEVGIDVKDYRDPVRLARRLGASLGGLRRYPQKILAVAARRARSEGYLTRLREHLHPALQQDPSLRVCSVDQVIRELGRAP